MIDGCIPWVPSMYAGFNQRMFWRERALEERVKRKEDLSCTKISIFIFFFLITPNQAGPRLLLLHVYYGTLLPDDIKRSRETMGSQRQSRDNNCLFLSKIHIHRLPPHSVCGSRAPLIPPVEVMGILSFHEHRQWIIFVAGLKRSKMSGVYALIHVSIAQAAEQIPT